MRACASSASSQSPSPAVEAGSSSDEQAEEESLSGQESSQGCKRKRASVETETDRDSDTDSRHQFIFLVLVCLSSLLPFFLSLLFEVFKYDDISIALWIVVHINFTSSSGYDIQGIVQHFGQFIFWLSCSFKRAVCNFQKLLVNSDTCDR